jgi:hypothetical protein
LPGTDRSGLEAVGIDSDLAFLQAAPELVRELEEERERAARDMARLGQLVEQGLFARIGIPDPSREHLRAAGAAYMADMGMARRNLSAPEILAEVYERAPREELRPLQFGFRPRLRAAFNRWWKANDLDREARRAAWRATVHDVDGARGALLAWSPGARASGERIMADLLRHPERISEQLVTLRIVQTLSLIDMLNYREHIYRLGDYAASGDDPGDTLKLA